ncbi:hypothetical protein MASR1M74_02030 [Lentimicrobium sp.]
MHQVRKAVGSYLPITGALGSLSWDIVPRFENAGKSQANITMSPGCSNRAERGIPSRAISRNGIVTVDAGIHLSSFIEYGVNTIGTLPVGFRPANPVEVAVIVLNQGGGSTLPMYNPSLVRINTDGSINIWRTDSENQTIYNAKFDIHVSFPV